MRDKNKQQSGFTIVELLIVIVIIGILAAITLVAYNGIQERARVSSVTSALSQAGKKLTLYQVDYPGQYPTAAGTDGIDNLAPLGITNTNGVSYQYSSATGTYCLTATTGSTSYKLNNTSTIPTQGGCNGHGQGGVATITNLHRNPGATTTTGYGSWSGDSGNVNSSTTVAAGWSQSNFAFRSTWTTVASVNGDIQVYINNGPVLSANTTYTLRYRLVAGQNSTIGPPTLYASAGTYSTVARSHSSDINVTTGTPVEVWLTFQGDATALASGFRVNQNPRNKVVGHYYELSEAVIYAGARDSSIGFFWGNSTNWAWNGTPNSSTSTGPPL